MRVGRWSKTIDYGEGSKSQPGFPTMPQWFRDNRDWENIKQGLQHVGFNTNEITMIMGGNWLKFYDDNFGSVK